MQKKCANSLKPKQKKKFKCSGVDGTPEISKKEARHQRYAAKIEMCVRLPNNTFICNVLLPELTPPATKAQTTASGKLL